MKRPSLSLLSLFALALTGVLAPSVAHADPQPCDTSTYYCVDTTNPDVSPGGPLKLSGQFPQLDLTNGLDTGWVAKCDPGVDHCGNPQVRFQADLSNMKIDLTMVGDIDLYWGAENGVEPGNLLACPRGTASGGKFAGTFTMSPTIGIWLPLGSNGFEFEIDPFELSGLLGGDEFVPAQFDFAASGEQTFTPWAFDPGVTVPLDGPLQPLITIPLSQIADSIFDTGGSVAGAIDLDLNIIGGTTDTKFIWETQVMNLKVGSAPAYEVTPANPCVTIPYTGGASMTIMTQLKGTFSYSGNTSIQPQLKVNSIAGFPFTFQYNFDVNADIPFGSQVSDLTFPSGQAIKKEFPLPDLFVAAADTIDFGKVEVGVNKSKTISLTNNGKLLSIGNTETTDPGAFTLKSESNGDASFQIDPSASDTINVEFFAKKEGPIAATLTITSNDPDEPVKTIALKGTGKITGEAGAGGTGGTGGSAGSGAGGSGNDPAADGVVTQDSGCGCRVAGETDETPRSAVALGLVGLALVAARRRRS